MYVGKTCHANPTSTYPPWYALHSLTELLKWVECIVLALDLQCCKWTGLRVEAYPHTMWNSRLRAGLSLSQKRRYSHCWTSWLALDKGKLLTIHARSGCGRMSAVISAHSSRCCTKWFGNRKFPGSQPSNYFWSQTLLNFNDYMTGTLSKVV